MKRGDPVTEHKEKGRGSRRAPRTTNVRLEVEFSSELQHARIPRTGRLPEGAAAEIRTDAIELGVVERVERLRTELEIQGLADLERLVNRRVDIEAAGSERNVLAGVAESVRRAAGPRGQRSGKYRRIEPLRRLLDGTRSCADVGTVP